MKVEELIKVLDNLDKDEFEIEYVVYDQSGDFLYFAEIESININLEDKQIVLCDGIY